MQRKHVLPVYPIRNNISDVQYQHIILGHNNVWVLLSYKMLFHNKKYSSYPNISQFVYDYQIFCSCEHHQKFLKTFFVAQFMMKIAAPSDVFNNC